MGLFGPSLDELVEKELSLRKNKNMPIAREVKTKKQRTLNQKITLICVSILLFVGVIIIGSTVYDIATRPKADYDGFKKSLSTYLSTNEDITEIQINGNDIFTVIVSDSWYNSSEVDKIRFCQNVHSSLYTYAYQYKLIYKDTDNVYINVYDTTGIKLADQNITDFDILH